MLATLLFWLDVYDACCASSFDRQLADKLVDTSVRCHSSSLLLALFGRWEMILVVQCSRWSASCFSKEGLAREQGWTRDEASTAYRSW